MNLGVLEFNDAGLALGDADRERLQSPGYAYLAQDTVVVGSAALASARLHPRQTQNRFWQRLGTEALPHPHARARHHADLAWLHLLHLHEEGGRPDELIFAVPASFSREQLAILLGIAGRCPFRAVGLVDAALAAASSVAFEDDAALHLDVQLHQSVLTRIGRDGARLRRVGERVLPGVGLVQFNDLWARYAAAEFIQQSRFDPMHSAATEQQLYDRLPGWLATLAEEGDVNAALGNGSNNYHAKLRAAGMLEAVRGLYLQLGEALGAERGQLLLSARIARLPRIASALGSDGLVLAPDAVRVGCLQHAGEIRSEDAALRFVTQLPARVADPARKPAPEPAARPAARPEARMPSHLVQGARAWRLDADTLHLRPHPARGWLLAHGASEEDVATLNRSGGAWWVATENGARLLLDGVGVARPTRAAAGACLRLPGHGDAEFRLVAEEAASGDDA